MKLFYFIIPLCTIGCAAKHVTFYPTSSPFVDSISANFSYAECKSIEQKMDTSLSNEENPMLVFSCTDPSLETSWTTRKFYVVKNIPNTYISEDLFPVCMDMNSIVFVNIKEEQ